MQLERQLITKKELRQLGIPYSFQHIARLEHSGKFPRRVQLGACRVAWCYCEVMEWIAERIALRDSSIKADDTSS